MGEALFRHGKDGECTRYTALENLARMAEHAALIEGQMHDLAEHAHEDHGVTWAEIGRALGVTRQAARQRFGHG
jgi:hypothetical protein